MFIFKHFRTRLESNLLTHFAMRYSVRWKTLSDPVPTHSHKIQEWTHTFRKPFLSVFFTDTLGKWQQKQRNIIAMDFFLLFLSWLAEHHLQSAYSCRALFWLPRSQVTCLNHLFRLPWYLPVRNKDCCKTIHPNAYLTSICIILKT